MEPAEVMSKISKRRMPAEHAAEFEAFVDNLPNLPSPSSEYRHTLYAKHLPQWHGIKDWEFAPLRQAAVDYRKDGKWDADWKKLLLHEFYAREIRYIKKDPDFINARYGGQGYEGLYKDWTYQWSGGSWQPRHEEPIIRHDQIKEKAGGVG
ncbi:hypothetical protein DPSP01_008329 [Paraphaeosphaeria sporulosa]|uniref:Uncharacterized protein n=1 Tax=Paraphaeosphaeria sporulosa TaxID=1460663 RepID=A0A177CLB0_9PLEO|nr:uncharacterized protein CC84DRAFT_1214566 [Paraphaeosphaeria sporulosa]OAG08021.1 hypothetical protein CC84DRAFT_1214566 [Paraphaeosphaeria sporulosa]